MPLSASRPIDERLRLRVRQLLETGELPRVYPSKLWVAPATTSPCCCCGEPIKAGYEYELTFPDRASLKFHPRCYVIWDEEKTGGSEGK